MPYLVSAFILAWCTAAAPALAQPFAAGGPGSVNAADYASIQAAVDALPDSGGLVYVPPGEYEVHEPIRIAKGAVTVMGAGAATLVRNVSTRGGNTFEIRGRARQDPIWRVQIRNLRLTGTG